MHSRSRLTLAVLVALATLPAVASAKPYRATDPLRISGPSPFAGGCPGSAFDDTHITGQELEPSITVNRADKRNIVAAWKQDVGPRGDRADRLNAAARDDGVALLIASAYRSDAEQAVLFRAHPDPKWVAPPGTSLHRYATELDLGPPSAYAWRAANAPRFHFVQRYDWEKTDFRQDRLSLPPILVGAA